MAYLGPVNTQISLLGLRRIDADDSRAVLWQKADTKEGPMLVAFEDSRLIDCFLFVIVVLEDNHNQMTLTCSQQ